MQAFVKRGLFLATRTHFTAARAFSLEQTREKGNAEERFFFDKEERESILRLLRKLDEDISFSGITSEGSWEEDMNHLRSIFNRYRVNVPDSLLNDIAQWKKDF